MSRTLGVWAKKQEVYLAFADDGVPRDEEPQRIEAPSIMEASERLGGFLTSFRHALDDVAPEAVRILQPEQIYQASYSEFAPKLALETRFASCATRGTCRSRSCTERRHAPCSASPQRGHSTATSSRTSSRASRRMRSFAHSAAETSVSPVRVRPSPSSLFQSRRAGSNGASSGAARPSSTSGASSAAVAGASVTPSIPCPVAR